MPADCVCPICGGPTHEIRAKLHCRQCGAILETCCEGGPMAPRSGDHPPPPPSSPPAQPDDFKAG